MPLSGGVSVVVPVYNSEPSLLVLLAKLEPVLRACTNQYEVVLVNDGSRDDSWRVICDLAVRYDWVRGFDMSRNYGQHNAVVCGIRQARYATVVTVDDDLQHPPEEIPLLLNKLEEGYDVVYGTPIAEQHGFFRDLSSRVTKFALKSAMSVDIARQVSAFRALRTRLRAAFDAYESPFVSVDVLLTWGTTRFAAVRVRHDPRREGASNYTFRKLLIHALNMLTGFSVWPLQFASLIGFAFTLFGFGVLLYVVIRYLFAGDPVPGFPFLASMIAIFSGAQLFAIGVIGEYLARMHFRTMNKPLYVIREMTAGAPQEYR